jgi:hypothetical protein
MLLMHLITFNNQTRDGKMFHKLVIIMNIKSLKIKWIKSKILKINIKMIKQ